MCYIYIYIKTLPLPRYENLHIYKILGYAIRLPKSSNTEALKKSQ